MLWQHSYGDKAQGKYMLNNMNPQVYQRERLSLETPKGDAIVQTTEETCRGEFEAVPPPRNRSVGLL
jgi:hypothetical protein